MYSYCMTRILVFLVLAGMIFSSSCANRSLQSQKSSKQKEIAELFQLMSGTFSSREQAQNDSSFYNINLVMHPIWEKNQEAKWLYVEQAVTRMIDKPYRQRVYKLTMEEDGSIASTVYELPNPSKYIHGWNQAEVFNQINPDSLILREGCAVYLTKDKQGCYTGSTKAKACKSSLRGASYATSKVTICPGQVSSWDQGWNDMDEQVWGAEKAGYIFKKI